MSNGTQIGNTILNQLGGNRFKVMTGSKNFLVAGISETNPNPWLRMDLTTNKSGANRLKITLNAMDTYDLHFYRQTMDRKTFDIKITKEQTFEGIYNDQLREIFTQVTGLYTSL